MAKLCTSHSDAAKMKRKFKEIYGTDFDPSRIDAFIECFELDNHANTLPTGQKQLIVAEVLVGKWTKGRKGMSSYPLLPGEQYKKYNSLVDNVVNPSIFVVQHSNEAYPAYLLTYHT